MTVSDRSSRLARRVALWQLASGLAIVLLFSIALLVAGRGQIGEQLDERLQETVDHYIVQVRAGVMDPKASIGRLVDSVPDIGPGERAIFLLDTSGTSLRPAGGAEWAQQIARDAARLGDVTRDLSADERTFRGYARRFMLPDSTQYVAMALMERPEVEDQQVGLVAILTLGAVFAVGASAGIGWVLARQRGGEAQTVGNPPPLADGVDRDTLEVIRNETKRLAALVDALADRRAASKPPPK